MANLASTIITGSLLVTGQTSGSDARFNTITASLSGTASRATTSSYADSIPSDININTLTASYISASTIVTLNPTLANQVATKEYVDSVSSLGLEYFFRTGSSGVSGYYAMYDLATPISSSIARITITAASASQYIASWISPTINLTSLREGTLNIHWHGYVSANGDPANSYHPEIYISSSAGIRELASGAPITILRNGISDSYESSVLFTSSIATNTTDRLICRLKMDNAVGVPTVVIGVDGSTSAGLTVPIPSSNFVIKTGDTMTGALIAPSFTGSLHGTASYATNALSASYAPNTGGGASLTTGSTYEITASWALNVISASHALIADSISGTVQFANTASHATYAENAGTATTATNSDNSISASHANVVENLIVTTDNIQLGLNVGGPTVSTYTGLTIVGNNAAGAANAVAHSTIIGDSAGIGLNGTNQESVMVGYGAGQSATSLNNDILIGYNVANGATGDHAVIIGDNACPANTAITNTVVVGAGGWATNGGISIGKDTNGTDGCILLGTGVTSSIANQMVLGSALTETTIIQGYAGTTILGPLTASGYLTGTASYALSSNVNLNGTNNYVPYWSASTLTPTSPIYVDVDHILINATVAPNPAAEETLLVVQGGADSFNIAGFYGDTDNYLQINTKNINPGTASSGDIVVTANDGDENNYFIDMGINSANFADPDYPLQTAHDGYLLINGGDLKIGADTAGKKIYFFTDGVFQAKIDNTGLHASGSVHSSSHATYAENAGFAISASYAQVVSEIVSASYISGSIIFPASVQGYFPYWSASVLTNTSPLSYDGTTLIGLINSASYAITASYVSGSSLSSESASYATTSSFALTANIVTASYISGSITFPDAQDGYFPMWSASVLTNTSGLFNNGTHIVASLPIQGSSSYSLSSSFAQTIGELNVYAGLVTTPQIIDNTSSFIVTVTEATVNLYHDVSGSGQVYQHVVPQKDFYIPAGINASFIYATSNGVTASYGVTTDFNTITGTDIATVATVYRADEDLHSMQSVDEGLALANKLKIRFLETDKFAWESGFALSETGSRHFIITAGEVWYGATEIDQGLFDSRRTESISLPTGYDEVHFAQHSASTWIIPKVADGTYNNSYYDNGTNLVPLSTGYYCVNYFYRILGDNQNDHDVFYLVGNNQYADVASAENDTVPADVPGVLTDVALLIGRMIVQSGSNTAAKIESARSTNFGAAQITSHNNLSGIQGGTSGQYYHLSSAQYSSLGVSSSYSDTSSYSIKSTLVDISSSASNTNFSLVLTTNSGSNKQLLIDGSDLLTYNPTTETLGYANLNGTASWATNAVSAISASYAPGSPAISASYALNSTTASYALGAKITYVSSSLQSPINLTSSSLFYNGPSITIPTVGIWMVETVASFRRTSTGVTNYQTRIADHLGNIYATSQMTMPSQNPHSCNMKVGAIINVTSPNTPFTCSVGSDGTATSIFLTHTGSFRPTGSNATQIWAINLQ